MGEQTVTLILRAKNLLTGTLNRASSSIRDLGASVVKLGKLAVTAFAALGAGAVAFGKKFIDAYVASERAANRLENTLKQTGYAAGFTSVELRKQASELQKLTGASDDAIVSTQAMLAATGQIKGDAFRRATVAALDLATALQTTGQDAISVEETARMLGRALADPVRGMTQLTRMGIILSETQREGIKAMAESGQAAQAQAALLDILEQRYGGASQAVNKNIRGLALLKETVGDIQETIGGAILNSDAFTDTIRELQTALDELAESGQIQLWAENAVEFIRMVKAEIQELTGLVPGWVKWIGREALTQRRQRMAFTGAMWGGSGVGGAFEAAANVEQNLAANRAAALDDIRRRREQKDAATEQRERQSMSEAHSAKMRQMAEDLAAKVRGASGDIARVQAARDKTTDKQASLLAEIRDTLETNLQAAGD